MSFFSVTFSNIRSKDELLGTNRCQRCLCSVLVMQERAKYRRKLDTKLLKKP